MPTSSSPKRPLPPTYRIERERVLEHDSLMKQARTKWGEPICPDCYQPAHLCAHLRSKT